MSNGQKYRWEQRGDKVCLWMNEGLTLWQLPIKLKDIHPDLLFLVECLLSYSYYKDEIVERMVKHVFTRKQGKHPGLCFSGGVDSLAAQIIMPKDTRLVYHKREMQIPGNCNYENVKALFEKLEQEVFVVPSNSDMFRMVHGDMCGYSSVFCCGLGVVLMADYLDLGYFATGMVLDSSYLSGLGNKYEDISTGEEFIWKPFFEKAGLPFYFPVASVGEVVTHKICKESGLLDLTVSCFVGTNCNKCIKCYRKLLVDLRPPQITAKVQKQLDIEVLPHYAIYTEYALKNKLVWNRYLDGDFSWLDQYYPRAFALIPDEFKEFQKEQIEKYAKPMKQPYLIEQIDLYKNKYPKVVNNTLTL